MTKTYRAADIRTILTGVWTKLGQIWLKDSLYCEFSPDDIVNAVKAQPAGYRRVISEAWDCDDIARSAVNAVQVRNAFDLSGANPVAFGSANGLKWNNETEPHTANVMKRLLAVIFGLALFAGLSTGCSHLIKGSDNRRDSAGSKIAVEHSGEVDPGAVITADFTGYLRMYVRFAEDRLSRELFQYRLYNVGLKMVGMVAPA
jgi:hypothetical protein